MADNLGGTYRRKESLRNMVENWLQERLGNRLNRESHKSKQTVGLKALQ